MEIAQIVKEENINGSFDDIEEKDKKKENSFIEEKEEKDEFSHEEKKDYGDKQIEYVVFPNNEIELLGYERGKDIIDPIDEIEIMGRERPLDAVQPIDEIQIMGKERPNSVIEPIDEIQIYGRERVHNVIEPIDEIEIMTPNKPDNVIYPSDEIQIMGKKHENDVSNSVLDISPNNDDDKSKERKIKMDKLVEEYNSSTNGNEEPKNQKIKEVIDIKQQIEDEKNRIKDLYKKMLQLETELTEEKDN